MPDRNEDKNNIIWLKRKHYLTQSKIGCVTAHTNAIEQYFHLVLLIMLRKVILNFKSADETLNRDHSNESC